MKQGRKGVNWVKNLLEYSKCLNNDKREELGWRFAFEVYYGRKSNEMVKCGVPVNREKEFNVQKVIQPSENLTRKSVIGQLTTTGREGSDRNIRKEKRCLSDMEGKTGKKRQNKDSSFWGR